MWSQIFQWFNRKDEIQYSVSSTNLRNEQQATPTGDMVIVKKKEQLAFRMVWF